MRASNRLPDTHMENKILPPPSGNSDVNFLHESTRKRKLTAVDQRETFSEIDLKCSFSKKSNLLPPKSFHCVGSLSLNKMPVGETLTISNGPTQAHNWFSQPERRILPPVPDFCSSQLEKSKAGLGLQDIMSFGYKNYVVADNQPLEVRYSSSRKMRPSDLLHQCFGGPDEFPVALDEKACLLENDQTVNTAGSSVATASLEPCTEHTENDKSLQNEKAAGNGTLGLCLSDKLREDDQGYRDGNILMMKKTKGSNLKNSLVQKISPRNGDNPADVTIKNDQRSENSHASSKSSDERSIPLAGKLAPTTSQKLWDGSLQLNSSITVSAVAFFKSGEKMPNVKWSNTAEVKGKVRLEAFERYIQDLSCSRNRGLMVISLCWKEGSSKSGLVGMKKVAKSYKEGERVGFVQLSPGIDLYVCPCSDTIITLLAKHGFFKGMAAVVDNKDSLIGCVVWRKNGASIFSSTTKSDKKKCSLLERPYNSSSGSSNQRSADKYLSCIQPIQDSIPVASETERGTLETAGNGKNQGKHLKSSEVELGLRNSSASTNLSLTSVMRPATFTDSNCAIDSASLKGSMSQLSDVEAPSIHNSSMERPELSLELQKPVLSLPSNVTKQPIPNLDDDDLPEFDFGTACGISRTQMSKPLDAATVDKKLLTEGLRKMVGPMQSIMPTVQSLSTFTKQRSEISNRSMFPLDDIQSRPRLKKVYIHGESQTTQSRGIVMPVSARAVISKNLFNCDDDDDMPEWCPPYVEPWKLPVPQITSPSITCVSSKAPNSAFERSSGSCLKPLLVTHPQISSHAFPHENHPSIDASMKVAQARTPDRYVQRGPSSSTVFNANPLPRPPPPNTFAVKLPVHPAGWRGWRP